MTIRDKEIIIAAANKIGDIILVGARHWDDLMCKQADAMGIEGGDEEQGFVNQYGEFRTREEAYDIVGENDQELKGYLASGYVKGSEGGLFSEHLY